MITAKEARELVEQSDATVKKRLDRISVLIRAEASLGKREVLLKDYLYHEDWMKVEKNPYRDPDFTPVQRLVKVELEKVGFTVDIHGYPITIGGGLGSMDDKPREGTGYAIRVRW
jgi:type II restriction/modification system DNA methylase subunit YeeA